MRARMPTLRVVKHAFGLMIRAMIMTVVKSLLFVTTSWTFMYENSLLWVGDGLRRDGNYCTCQAKMKPHTCRPNSQSHVFW